MYLGKVKEGNLQLISEMNSSIIFFSKVKKQHTFWKFFEIFDPGCFLWNKTSLSSTYLFSSGKEECWRLFVTGWTWTIFAVISCSFLCVSVSLFAAFWRNICFLLCHCISFMIIFYCNRCCFVLFLQTHSP